MLHCKLSEPMETPSFSHMLHNKVHSSQSGLGSGCMLCHMTKHYSPGSSRDSLRAQNPLAPWYGYGIPWSFLLWNRGEPRKLFLMVCRRDFQGVFCTPGDVGGVGLGLCDGVPRLCFGLRTGEPFGLLEDKLAFLLKYKTMKERYFQTVQFISKYHCYNVSAVNNPIIFKLILGKDYVDN